MKQTIEELRKEMFTKKDMLDFAWYLVENVGQYSCDKTAHFKEEYLNDFQKLITKHNG